MKRILCLLFALALLSAGFAAQAESGEWVFDYDDYKLTGYQGAGGAVVIPEEIDGCTVDILGMDLFSSDSDLTSLTLPSTAKQIEANVASFCDNLTQLVIPEGVQVIGDNSFICNPALTEVTVPATVRYIGSGSFGSNDSLSEVTFLGECPVFAGAALDWIAEDAVVYVPDDQYDAYAEALYEAECYSAVLPSGANAVTYDWTADASLFEFDAATGTITLFTGFGPCVEIPAEIGGVPVRAIGEHAFEGHPYLCCLTLPEGLESIGESAFEWCENLVYIEFPSTLRTIGNRAFYAGYMGAALELPAVETIGDEAFSTCPFISEPIDLPDGLKSIGNSAFDGCGWLTEIYVPASVETIGERAFADTSVNYLVFEGRTLPQMADSALENCGYLADIDLHSRTSKQEMLDMQAKVDALGLECRVWRMQNPDVDYVEDGLDVYENGVLVSYSGEQSHLRPWDTYDEITVTALGDGAFRGSQTIGYFAVPYNDAFTTIGAEAFADSTLHTVDLFDSVTTINGGAFRNCVNLTELILPESVEFVGAEALSGCTGLKTLYVMCDPAVLPEDLFDVWPEDLEIYASDSATGEQLKYLSRIAGRPFYNPVTRMSDDLPVFRTMPYAALPGGDFWYDAEFARLDEYQGYELNLVLPREIDGNPLTMIGGGMMQRAAYGDNYDLELPVVSVVIPENYTDIPYYTFANCETLETVICYAPLETLSECMFKNCTSLREVIFVNGVANIENYVFDNCPNLQTVYVGPYVESVGEYAFCDEFGEPLWSLDKCITDPAQMPDVDALLAAVKRDPMPEPTPEPTPEPVLPVGEEGQPYFGLWNGVEMVMDGYAMNPADYGMIMKLLLLEDGRMIMDDEGADLSDPGVLDGVEAPGWRVENGVAIGDGCTMTIGEDGRLVLEEDGFQLIFERDGDQPAGISAPAAPAEAPAPETGTAVYAQIGAEGQPYFGVWNGVEMVMDGYAMNPADFGMTMTLVLLEDGRMILDEEGIDLSDPSVLDGVEAAAWRVENGVAAGEGCTMTIGEDGRLVLEEDGSQLIFERTGDQPTGISAPAAPAETPASPAPEAPVESAEAAAAAPEAAAQNACGGMLEVKYVCVNADVSGYTMDASMLGGEYSMTFHEDGTLDFVVVGSPIPGLKWTQMESGNFMADLYGNQLEIVWTEAGFDMNYMDAMLMHFVPEA